MFKKLQPLPVSEGYLTDKLASSFTLDLQRLLAEQDVELQLEAREDLDGSKYRGLVLQHASVDQDRLADVVGDRLDIKEELDGPVVGIEASLQVPFEHPQIVH